MARKATLILLLLLLALPSMAWGHAEYKEASPGKGEVVTTEINEINLIFSTNIEALSTLELLDSNGNVVEGEVTAEGDQLHAAFAAPLPSGNYTVNWRTLGVDGHVLHGDYTFTVELPAPPAAAAPDSESDNPAGTSGTDAGGDTGSGGGDSAGAGNDTSGTPPAEDSEQAAEGEAPTNEQPANRIASGSNQEDIGTDATPPADDGGNPGNTLIYVLIGIAVIAIIAGFGIKARRRQGKR